MRTWINVDDCLREVSAKRCVLSSKFYGIRKYSDAGIASASIRGCQRSRAGIDHSQRRVDATRACGNARNLKGARIVDYADG
jgi:hypothetical protein